MAHRVTLSTKEKLEDQEVTDFVAKVQGIIEATFPDKVWNCTLTDTNVKQIKGKTKPGEEMFPDKPTK